MSWDRGELRSALTNMADAYGAWKAEGAKQNDPCEYYQEKRNAVQARYSATEIKEAAVAEARSREMYLWKCKYHDKEDPKSFKIRRDSNAVLFLEKVSKDGIIPAIGKTTEKIQFDPSLIAHLKSTNHF